MVNKEGKVLGSLTMFAQSASNITIFHSLAIFFVFVTVPDFFDGLIVNVAKNGRSFPVYAT